MWNGIDIVLWLQGIRQNIPDIINDIISALSDILYLVIPIAIAFYLFWCKDKRSGSIAMMTLSLSLAVIPVIKGLLCVPRPWVSDSRVVPVPSAVDNASGLSCPSGHTAVASNMFCTLAIIMKSRIVTILCIAAIFITALSRVYLGVHTPLDVTVGAIVGLATATIGYLTISWMEKIAKRDIVVFSFLLGIIVLATIATYILPSGYVDGNSFTDHETNIKQICKYLGITSGAVIGWFAERRFVNFDPSIPNKTKRYLIGLLSSCAIFVAVFGLFNIFNAKYFGYLFGGFAFMTYAFAIFPWIVKNKIS